MTKSKNQRKNNAQRNRDNRIASLERAPIHRLQRTIFSTVPLVAADSGGSYVVDPTGGGIADFTALADVFDTYRVSRVEFTWVCPRSDAAEFPTLVYAPDWNDSTAPTLTQLLAYESSKMIQFSEHKRSHTFNYRPKARLAITAAGAGGGASTDVSILAPVWGNPLQSLQWYGVKWFLVNYNTTSNATAIVSYYAKVYLEFKNSR